LTAGPQRAPALRAPAFQEVRRMSESADLKPTTGTFLDGIPCDIPSQNWGRTEWQKQFAVFEEMGMDTVVIIRVG